jgi:hypothetical protein
MPYRIRNHHSGGQNTTGIKAGDQSGFESIGQARTAVDGRAICSPSTSCDARRPRHQIVKHVQRSQQPPAILLAEPYPIDLIDPHLGGVVYGFAGAGKAAELAISHFPPCLTKVLM